MKPLLAQRSFGSLWWGQLVSILGERLTYLALGGLLLEHTNRGADAHYPVLLAMLGNVMAAPVLLFAPFTGAWVDRQNLQRVLVISDLLRSAIVLLMPWAYDWTGNPSTTFALVFLLFTCNVVFLPAKSAITPEIVAGEQLLAANSLLSVAGIVATMLGALGGGWFVDHYGWRAAMQINAITYLVSVVALALIVYRPERHHAAAAAVSGRAYLREVAEGWALVRKSSAVGLGLLALAAVWLGGGFLHVAGNPHIQRAASVPGMERVGILLTALGLGSGISTWWVNTHGRAVPRGRLLGLGLVLAGLALVAFAVSRRFAVFAASGFLVGLFIAPAFVLPETLLQEGTEPKQRARVFSARDFLMRLMFLIAITVSAALVKAFGSMATLLASAGLLVVIGIVALAWKLPEPASGRAA